jgi:hypothetical protein
MLRRDKERKRIEKRDRVIQNKFELRQKMSVIATNTGAENDEELALPKKLLD